MLSRTHTMRLLDIVGLQMLDRGASRMRHYDGELHVIDALLLEPPYAYRR